jgi:hypothetical protein
MARPGATARLPAGVAGARRGASSRCGIIGGAGDFARSTRRAEHGPRPVRARAAKRRLRAARCTVSLMPPFIAPATFDDAATALARVREIYEASVDHLRNALQTFVTGAAPAGRVRACYPFIRVHTDTVARADSRLSYGFVSGPGTYETTLTRPDLFESYYLEQFRLLLENHGVSLEVGTSVQPIPVHFSFAEHDHIEGNLSADQRLLLRDLFDLPDLGAMDDGIANGTYVPAPVKRVRSRSSLRRASTTRCTGCVTTPAPIPSTSRTSSCSRTTSSTSTSSFASATRRWRSVPRRPTTTRSSSPAT